MDIIDVNCVFSSRYGHFMMVDSVKILFLYPFFNFGRMMMFSRPLTDVIFRPFVYSSTSSKYMCSRQSA